MDLVDHIGRMALNNAWSNHRLIKAMAALSDAAWKAERLSFFPSLCATMNHILIVDWFYLDALKQGGRGRDVFESGDIPCPGFTVYAEAQYQSDRDLIACCDGLSNGDLVRKVRLDRETGFKTDTIGNVLPHLFQHQIHHRGQAHAMLSGTDVAPPQLDEFFLDEDRSVRADDLAELGIR